MEALRIELGLAAICPGILAFIFILLEKKTAYKKLNQKIKYAIVGICYGLLAVADTEFGIPINGAQVNTRDAAVLTAGLFFGGPAGIIAGLIGGIERFFAVYWGIGTYTRIACSVSTIVAGFYAAFLRKYLFHNRKPGAILAFAIGMVMEVFHLTMIFLTNMNDAVQAATVVKNCSVIMITANSFGTMFSAFIFNRNYHEDESDNNIPRISATVRKWLLICVTIVFALTSYFVYQLQTSLAEKQASNYLKLASSDLVDDINDTSDSNLLEKCYTVKQLINYKSLEEIAKDLDVAEVSIIDHYGLIKESSVPEYINFDMEEGEQSREFMCLIDDVTEFVQKYGKISRDSSMYRKYAGIKYKDGFIQVGYDAGRFQREIGTEVAKLAANRHVGNSGFILVFDKDGWPICKHENVTVNKFSDIQKGSILYGSEAYRVSIDGQDYLGAFINTEGYDIVSLMPVDEAYNLRDTAVIANTFMEILVFALLFFLVYKFVELSVVNKIDEVNNSLDNITKGNLDEVVNVRSNYEFNELSDDINQTVDTLKKYIAEASARIDAELEYAKNIQSSALPHIFPTSKYFEVYALMNPAKEVGGDFYDFYRMNANLFHFLVADVSGKGIPGAMFMMRAKSTLSALNEMHLDVNEVFTVGNNRLCEGNDAGMFVTAWDGRLDLRDGVVRFANAGHNPPVIRRADGSVEFVNAKKGFVLAGMEGISYKQQELALNPGDTLFLYTDGVVEATDANKELYGNDRLLNILAKAEFESMSDLCNKVLEDVNKFVGDAEQFDDITMLAVRFTGKRDD